MNNSDRKSKTCALVPFYNEENFILEVVQRSLEFVDLIIAVNDGSTDNSRNLIKDLSDVIIVLNKKNSGKGSALQKGFDEFMKLEYEYLITLDGDLQHDPELIPQLVGALEKYDLVIGNRLNDLSKMPFIRVLSNKITSFLLTLKTKQKIKDSQCGFRAFRKNVLGKVKTTFDGYEAESEMIVKAARNNFSIGFVDVPTIYANEQSKMRSFQAIKGFLKVLFI